MKFGIKLAAGDEAVFAWLKAGRGVSEAIEAVEAEGAARSRALRAAQDAQTSGAIDLAGIPRAGARTVEIFRRAYRQAKGAV